MPNTSSTGGYLAPSTTATPLEGNALVDFLQAWVAGITGIAGQYIRPRWQPEPPNIPSESTDWIAFGITKRTPDTFAAELHFGAGDGYNELRRHEVLEMLVSFYGPNADLNASLFRDGIQIDQNREALSAQNMGLVETGEPIAAPELFKEKWLYRVDLPLSIRRQIVRDYTVQNILTANGTLDNEHYTTPIVN